MLLVLAAAGCDSVFGLDSVYECPTDDDDCDRLLDAVDPCPADPGSDDDEDRDGVGDECDPNRGMATDRRLDFDGFTANPERWMARGTATFDIDRSELALESGAVERAVAANSQPTVEIVLDPTFVAEGDTVGVYVASKSSTGIPLECRIEHHAAGDDLVMLLGDPSMGTPAEVARATMLPGSPKDGLRIYGGQLANFKIRCRARYGASDGLYVDWDLFRAAADFDTVGLRVQKQARADYRSVTIFTTVPP
jgi:hypothetical protein